jgi:hypothetical protein
MRRFLSLSIGGFLVLFLAGLFLLGGNLRENCFDGASRYYFDRQYLSAEEKEVIADSYSCGGRMQYRISFESSYRKVSKKRFDSFLEDFDDKCNSCLVYKGFVFGPDMDKNHYYDYPNGEEVSR